MAKVIVVGHGGFGTAIKNNLAMILGEAEGFYYVDFNAADDLESLEAKLKETMEACGNDEILFACDLAGGSPFRQAAVRCVENPKYRAVAGINVAAYAEMAYNLGLTVAELADLAVETTQSTIIQFPLEEE